MTATVTVRGFEFRYTDLVWDSRTMYHVPHYVCPEIDAGLVYHGAHWSCRICATAGAGDTAEQAFGAAYRALDTRVDRLTTILNIIHARGAITS